jgi:hypothetical protein
VTISKFTDDLVGGWKGTEKYWELFEPMVCNLTTVKKNRSAFTDEELAAKDICFEHYIQALISRKKFLKQ